MMQNSLSFTNKKASALLLSFFLMSVLVMLSISVSILVVKDLETVRTIVGGTRAYYVAEGVTELGLQELKDNLPGYEPSYAATELNFLNAAVATLASMARSDTNSVPCEGQGDWHALGPNESAQIPLFAQVDDAGNIEPTEGLYMDFYVEFYAADEEEVVHSPATTRDVLRWKVLGRTGTLASPGATEAMSEYIPLYNDEGFYTADSPTRFGSNATELGTLPPGYQDGKFYSSSGATYDAGYPISTFLSNHVFNYLVLTNVITESTANEVIYFRFHASNYAPVCEYVELDATGTSDYGSAQQELETLVKEGENLPVFDFVIYHTTGAESETTTSSGGTGSFPTVTAPSWASALLGS